MLKRLRTAHPILYCILSEVLFLGSMVVFSLLVAGVSTGPTTSKEPQP